MQEAGHRKWAPPDGHSPWAPLCYVFKPLDPAFSALRPLSPPAPRSPQTALCPPGFGHTKHHPSPFLSSEVLPARNPLPTASKLLVIFKSHFPCYLLQEALPLQPSWRAVLLPAGPTPDFEPWGLLSTLFPLNQAPKARPSMALPLLPAG